MDTDRTFKLAIAAIWTVFKAMRRMPLVFAIAFIVVELLLVGSFVLMPTVFVDPVSITVGQKIAFFALALLQAFLLTPMIIAVHRYVLLGETTRGYPLNVGSSRFWLFFLFSTIFMTMFSVPFAIAQGFTSGAGIVAALLLVVVGIIVGLRLLLIFPAIAVDAAGADWRAAMADARGNVWTLFRGVLSVVVISVAGTMVLSAVFMGVGWLLALSGLTIAFLESLVRSFSTIFTLGANATIASWFFQAFGNRLKRGVGQPDASQALG